MGMLDWLFGGGAQAQTMPPIPQGAVPQPVPATVPRTGNPFGMGRDVQIQAALAGLGQFGQNLAEQYRRRPVGAQLGPMGNVSDAVTRSMMTAYQRRAQEREEESDRRWSELQAGNPALAGLPREVGQQVLARTLTREPPDPRRNFITTRTGIYRIGPDGNPQLVQGPGMGGGGAGGSGGGAGAPGGMFRGISMEAQSLNILTRGDPASPEYAAVYAREAAPRVAVAPDASGNLVPSLVYPDMSPFRPPTFRHPTPGQPEAPVAADPTGYVAGGAQATLQPADAPQVAAPAAPLAAPPAAPAPVQPPQMAQATPQPAAPPSPGTPRIVPAGPPRADPAVLRQVREFEMESGRVLEAVNNFERLANSASGLTRFRAWLRDPTSPEAAEIQQAYDNMMTTLRSPAFLNTGVLQPGEMVMLREMLRDPTSWRGALTTPEARTAQLNQIRQMIQSGIARQRASIQQPGQALQPVIDQPQAAPGAVPPRGSAPAVPRRDTTAPENRQPGPSRYRTGTIPPARDISMMGVNQRDDIVALANRWSELNAEQQAAVRARLQAITQELRGQR